MPATILLAAAHFTASEMEIEIEMEMEIEMRHFGCRHNLGGLKGEEHITRASPCIFFIFLESGYFLMVDCHFHCQFLYHFDVILVATFVLISLSLLCNYFYDYH